MESLKFSQPAPSEIRTSEGLLRSLGVFSTTMLVIGGVIGSGIFRKPGVMAAQLGSPELLLFVWLLGGVITLMGALTNAEIAAMIPETGGQYVFFHRIYGPFFAFIYGWAVLVVIQTGSIAAVAYVFAEYSGQFVALPPDPAFASISVRLPFIGEIAPFKDLWTKAVAAAAIIGLTALNYLGVRFGGLVQNIFTVGKLAAMALLVIAAFLLPSGGSLPNLTEPSLSIQPHGWMLVASIAAALQGAFWAYDGWNKVPYVAGEMKDPQRILPRALLLGMLVVTGVYLLMNFAYAYVLPIDEMARSKLVAADVAERCFRGGGRWIAAAVMVSTFGAANAIILATARVFFAMARAKALPALFGAAHPRFHTPGASLILQGVWSVVLLFSGTFDTLTDMLIFVSWIFYAAAAAGVFILRRREPETPRAYRVPGYPWVPVLFIAFSMAYLVLTVVNDVTGYRAAQQAGQPAVINSVFGLALVLVGVPLFFLFRRRQ